MSDAVVTTKAGKVQGVKLESYFSGAEYYAFYGVPYAQPPIADLRFRVIIYTLLFLFDVLIKFSVSFECD